MSHAGGDRPVTFDWGANIHQRLSAGRPKSDGRERHKGIDQSETLESRRPPVVRADDPRKGNLLPLVIPCV